MDEGKKFVKVSVSLPKQLIEEIDRVAEEEGFTRSELIRIALRRFLVYRKLGREEVMESG